MPIRASRRPPSAHPAASQGFREPRRNYGKSSIISPWLSEPQGGPGPPLPHRDADLFAGPQVGRGAGGVGRGVPLDDDLLTPDRDLQRLVLGDHLLADPDLTQFDHLLADLKLLLVELNRRALADLGGGLR